MTNFTTGLYGKNLAVALTLVLTGANSCSVWGRSPAPKTGAMPTEAGAAAIKLREMQNCKCVVPNLGNGDDSEVQLKNGQYKLKNDSVNGTEEGTLRCTTSGVLNGKPTGFAVLSWNTGGSGNWTAYILFERMKDKLGGVRGARYFSPEYPAINGWIDKVRLCGDKVLFDLKNVAMDFRQAGDDGPNCEQNLDGDSKVLSAAELMESTIWLPTPDKLYDGDALAEKVQLHKGHYKKNGFSCTLTSIMRTKVQGELQTLGLGQISTGGKAAPLLVAFRFKRLGGKANCQGYYSLANKYRSRALAEIKGNPGKDSLIVKALDVSLNSSDFQKPNYPGSTGQK